MYSLNNFVKNQKKSFLSLKFWMKLIYSVYCTQYNYNVKFLHLRLVTYILSNVHGSVNLSLCLILIEASEANSVRQQPVPRPPFSCRCAVCCAPPHPHTHPSPSHPPPPPPCTQSSSQACNCSDPEIFKSGHRVSSSFEGAGFPLRIN